MYYELWILQMTMTINIMLRTSIFIWYELIIIRIRQNLGHWIKMFVLSLKLNNPTELIIMRLIQNYRVDQKNVSLLQTKTLSTSYSKTTILLGVEIWQLGVLMSTPCCQISTPYRLVVSEYEVPKAFVCKSDTFFLVHPVLQ